MARDAMEHKEGSKSHFIHAGKSHRPEGSDVGRHRTGNETVPEVAHAESNHVEFSDFGPAMIVGKAFKKTFDFTHGEKLLVQEKVVKL